MALPWLSYWLVFVAVLRSISVVLGYLSPKHFHKQLFNTTTNQVSALMARTFSIWTFITCALSLIAAYHLHERGIYLATMLSFYAAAFYFLVELLVFGTVKLKDWSVCMALAVGTISATWMTLSWSQYHSKLW